MFIMLLEELASSGPFRIETELRRAAQRIA